MFLASNTNTLAMSLAAWKKKSLGSKPFQFGQSNEKILNKIL
jgi:hypothetical protein